MFRSQHPAAYMKGQVAVGCLEGGKPGGLSPAELTPVLLWTLQVGSDPQM